MLKIVESGSQPLNSHARPLAETAARLFSDAAIRACTTCRSDTGSGGSSQVTADLVAAERAEEEGTLDEIKIIDPDKRAVTQILEEYAPEGTPVIIETVVERIDEIVRPVRGTGWQES